MREYRDYYFKKAKQENYPARSVYKLREIDNRFHVLKPGAKVLDLGAAPGSWSMEAARKVGGDGLIIACDLQPLNMTKPQNLLFFQTDIFNIDENFSALLKEKAPFDLVLSDMAPATTGSKFTDQARSLELAMRAFEMAQDFLASGGNFIVKIFMGPDVNELLAPMRKYFKSARAFKPKSSRAESRETFFIGLDLKDLKNNENIRN